MSPHADSSCTVGPMVQIDVAPQPRAGHKHRVWVCTSLKPNVAGARRCASQGGAGSDFCARQHMLRQRRDAQQDGASFSIFNHLLEEPAGLKEARSRPARAPSLATPTASRSEIARYPWAACVGICYGIAPRGALRCVGQPSVPEWSPRISWGCRPMLVHNRALNLSISPTFWSAAWIARRGPTLSRLPAPSVRHCLDRLPAIISPSSVGLETRWPNPGHLWHASGQLRPTRPQRGWAKCGLESGGFGPNSARVGVIAADIVPMLANIGPDSTDLDATRRNVCQLRPRLQLGVDFGDLARRSAYLWERVFQSSSCQRRSFCHRCPRIAAAACAAGFRLDPSLRSGGVRHPLKHRGW